MANCRWTTLVLFLLLGACPAIAQTREEKVRADREKVEAEGFWIYNDLDRAYQEAFETGKPILVSMRCLPCEECVKLDDDLIDNDRVVRALLEKFVCVRVVGTNGLDLETFQFDTDQSFAMFMLNADRTIYGRFGTRSHHTQWIDDVSIEGLAEALSGALELHKNYPANQKSLAGKRGRPLEFATAERFPSLKGKYTDQLNYSGDVVKSCIHCHQIGDARRDFYWSQSKPIPEKLVFPFPHPKSIGLVLDPKTRARVKKVIPGTPAANSALRTNDEIERVNGQPILSMADVQWVLHNVPSGHAELQLDVRCGNEVHQVAVALPGGWRQLDDTSWRVSSWGMCRMMTGGMRLQVLTDQQRREEEIPSGMALRATHLGRYGQHAMARKAGLREGDIIIAYDGRTDLNREADLFAYASANRKPGDRVQITYLRSGRKLTVSLPIQK